jgi:RNA polymerase sigma-70 factor (ECF subfamily)
MKTKRDLTPDDWEELPGATRCDGSKSGGTMSLQEISSGHRRAIEYSGFVRASCDDERRVGSLQVTPVTDDAILDDGLRSGDEEMFEQMVWKFGGRLLTTARRYLGSEDDALDALQDAFLCAFKSMGRFSGDSQLSTWLHRIVINSALMHLRARRRRPDTAGVEIDELLPHFDCGGDWIDEYTRTMPVHVSFEAAETQSLVRRCIEELSEAYRVVLILRDIDELDTAEVARLLGLTPNNVKVRLHRARQALKVLIERQWAV